MPNENLNKRKFRLKFRLKYTMPVDGKDKTITQSYENVKLTSTVNELYSTGESLRSFINAPSVDYEKDDCFTLSND